jgi:hypothetical protein
MANTFDINLNYNPDPNYNSQNSLFPKSGYSVEKDLSTSNKKLNPYVIDLFQYGNGSPGITYSIESSQTGTGTPTTIYSAEKDLSTSNKKLNSYTVNTDQSSTTTTFGIPYNVNTDQSETGTFGILYNVNTDQSETGIFGIPYNVNTQVNNTSVVNSNFITLMSVPELFPPMSTLTQEPKMYIPEIQLGNNLPYNENSYYSDSITPKLNILQSADSIKFKEAASNYFSGLNVKLDQLDLSNTGLSAASALLGSNSILDGLKKPNTFETLPFDKLTKNPALPGNSTFQDYRQRFENKKFIHGAAAALRGSATAGAYTAAQLLPGGAYTIFNLESTYGFPDSNPESDLDFTARTEVATTWNKIAGSSLKVKNLFKKGEKAFEPGGQWQQTINPLESLKEFTGDKVSVIDFSQRGKNNIYQWKPEGLIKNFIDNKVSILGDTLDKLGVGQTSDLIKFYFTGPKLHANSNEQDDVIVFRAIINSLTDSFSGNWNALQFIGRADPNYTYQGFSRNFDIGFTIYATHRDELKPIYRKLNYLASYTAPEYSNDTIVMKAPYLRITVGDLLVHQPIAISSIMYTFQDSETTWEINIEKDPTNMEVPKKIDVTLSGFLITDYLPQKGGRFYTLAKEFDNEGQPKAGNKDWLSDSMLTPDTKFDDESIAELQEKQKNEKEKNGVRGLFKKSKDIAEDIGKAGDSIAKIT